LEGTCFRTPFFRGPPGPRTIGNWERPGGGGTSPHPIPTFFPNLFHPLGLIQRGARPPPPQIPEWERRPTEQFSLFFRPQTGRYFHEGPAFLKPGPPAEKNAKPQRKNGIVFRILGRVGGPDHYPSNIFLPYGATISDWSFARFGPNLRRSLLGGGEEPTWFRKGI